ncbi:MAG: hypothetical protein ACLU6B_10005 [Lachnospirales bacterium]
MMKKMWAWMLIVILALGLLPGCGQEGEESSAQTPSQVESVAEENSTAGVPEDEPIALTFLCQINVDTEGYDVNDNPYINYVREANNLDITLISESANYASKVSTIMSSGELPDYVQLSKDLYYQYAQGGLLLELDGMLNETDYPNLMSGVSEEYWGYSKVDGKIYGIPFVRYDTTPYISYARKDWMDALEIDPADLKTVDDYYNMLYAFTYSDPDGNGQDDTYGLSSCTGGTARDSVAERYMGMLFLDAFDAASMKVIDGQVTPNYILDGYKDYLAFLAKCYADGIIVPDYITKTQTQTEEEFRNGKFGVLNLFWSLSGLNEMRDNLYPLTPPERVDGSGQSQYVYPTPVRHYIGITTDCEYPEAILKLYDWSETDEGSVYVHAGVEGWDYDMVDGTLVIREDRVGINWAWRFLTLGHQKSNVDEQLLPILTQSWGEDAMDQLKLSEEYGTNDSLYVSSPVFSELADYDLDTYVAQYRDQVIMGQVNLDDTWEEYVQGWKDAGGQVWMDLYTEWYNTSYQE